MLEELQMETPIFERLATRGLCEDGECFKAAVVASSGLADTDEMPSVKGVVLGGPPPTW